MSSDPLDDLVQVLIRIENELRNSRQTLQMYQISRQSPSASISVEDSDRLKNLSIDILKIFNEADVFAWGKHITSRLGEVPAKLKELENESSRIRLSRSS